jgi:hypothetical protein
MMNCFSRVLVTQRVLPAHKMGEGEETMADAKHANA